MHPKCSYSNTLISLDVENTLLGFYSLNSYSFSLYFSVIDFSEVFKFLVNSDNSSVNGSINL